tara:strand:+ start:55 stop:363 length:309 start_codon:yes stop_codon:yes gene_type:complete
MGATFNETISPNCALDVSLSLPFVNGASAQSAGTPAALSKAHEEVATELDRAAAIINSAAGVSVSISLRIYVRRRMSRVLQYAVIIHSAWKFTVLSEGATPW